MTKIIQGDRLAVLQGKTKESWILIVRRQDLETYDQILQLRKALLEVNAKNRFLTQCKCQLQVEMQGMGLTLGKNMSLVLVRLLVTKYWASLLLSRLLGGGKASGNDPA